MADDKTEKAEKAPRDDAAAKAAAQAKRASKKKGKEDARKAGFAANIEEGLKPVPARLRLRYRKEVVPALMKELGLKNPNEVPKLTKIVVNMGLGEALANNKIMESAVDQLAAITGQKPIVTRSRKAIANFKRRAVDTLLVRVPDASHSLDHRPSQLNARIAYILAWFAKHDAAATPAAMAAEK